MSVSIGGVSVEVAVGGLQERHDPMAPSDRNWAGVLLSGIAGARTYLK